MQMLKTSGGTELQHSVTTLRQKPVSVHTCTLSAQNVTFCKRHRSFALVLEPCVEICMHIFEDLSTILEDCLQYPTSCAQNPGPIGKSMFRSQT